MSEKLDALRGLLAKIEAGEPDLSFSLGKHIDAWPDDMWNGDTITLNTIGHAYQGSLDAAKALHEAALGNRWVIDRLQMWPPNCRADLLGVREDRRLGEGLWHSYEYGRVEAKASDPARAWLLAILRALIAEATK